MDRNPENGTQTDNQEPISYEAASSTERLDILTEKDLPQAMSYESFWSRAPVILVGLITFISGLTTLIQPLATRLASHPKLFFVLNFYDYYHWSRMLSVTFALFLMYLSVHIWKRKRVAWITVFTLSLCSAALHLARYGSEYMIWIEDRGLSRDLPGYTVILPLATVALLLLLRKRFTVASDDEDVAHGVLIGILSAVFLIGYGTFGFWLLEVRDFGVNFQFQEAFVRAANQLAFLGDSDLVPKSRFAAWFLDSLHILEGCALVYVSYSLFRPIQYQLMTLPKERQAAASLLDAHGRDALDHYKLLADKSYFFEAQKQSFVAYKTALNVAVCLGDPVGETSSLADLVRSFQLHCHDNDWKVAFLQVSDRNLEIFRSLGFRVLKVGEDAVVPLSSFTEKTVRGKSFKSTVRKLEKQGLNLVKREPPHDRDIIEQVRAISDQWLSLPGRRERGFSLGWFDEQDLQSGNLYIVESKEGEKLAFVNQVRSYAPGQASIDMMRHRTEVPNGTMDFLFARLLSSLHEEGYESFNLGLAALSGVGDKPGASLEEKAVHQIYEHMNRFFSYKGLRRYKSKFKPQWEDRYLIYEGGTPGLIKTALAITRAGEI